MAVLGASPKKERYANMALHLLREKGHEVFPINPAYKEIDGIPCWPQLSQLPNPVDTVSLYVSDPALFLSEILAAKPRRVIFNPGTESPALYPELKKASIFFEEACTLVLLRTEQF